MTPSDQQVGAMVRQCRESSLLSQQDLASAMRNLGYKWSQATVWSVESGERALRYTEALDLSRICGFGIAEQDSYREGIQRGLEISRQALERISP